VSVILYIDRNSQDKDQLILEAAKRVFVRKGMDGAVMQDIADEAGINRTALHYYFRSKKKLFEAVFNDLFNRFIPEVEEVIYGSTLSFQAKVEWFVDNYLDLLKENPYLPNFIMNELNKNPAKIVERFIIKGLLSVHISQWLEDELGYLESDIPASHFMANMISMCVFPFIAKPLFEAFLSGNKHEAFNRFIDERKHIIVETLMCSISKRRMPESLNN